MTARTRKYFKKKYEDSHAVINGILNKYEIRIGGKKIEGVRELSFNVKTPSEIFKTTMINCTGGFYK